MRHIMKHAVIVSGGNINTDFALDFLKKNTDENTLLIAADRGLEFFERTGLVPDIAVGDFDSLSESGNFWKHSAIRRSSGFARKRTIRIRSRQPVLP